MESRLIREDGFEYGEAAVRQFAETCGFWGRSRPSSLPRMSLRWRTEACGAGWSPPLSANGWEINQSAMRFAMTGNSTISDARLVKGRYVCLR
jgi:hypothetical protein